MDESSPASQRTLAEIYVNVKLEFESHIREAVVTVLYV